MSIKPIDKSGSGVIFTYIMPRSPELRKSSPAEYCRTGDYVVPTYSEFGRKIEEGEVVGSERRVSAMALKIAEHAVRNNGQKSKVIAPSKPTTKKASVKAKPLTKVKLNVDANYEEEMPSTPVSKINTSKEERIPTKKIDVTFRTQFGKIKVRVIGILETDLSITLVFADDDSVTFIPEQGDQLDLLLDGVQTHTVIFPGDIDTWLDNEKKLMKLFKVLKDE